MSVLLPFPEYLPYDHGFGITVQGGEYNATMKVRVDHVQKVRRGWRYSLMIDEIGDRDKREYLQILYDRPHSFARTSNVSMLILVRNIFRGIVNRRKNAQASKRRLPNIAIPFAVQSREAGEVNVVGFDYNNIVVRGRAGLPDKLTFAFGEGVEAVGYRGFDGDTHRDVVLYEIENWKELAGNSRLRKFITRILTRGDVEKGRGTDQRAAQSA